MGNPECDQPPRYFLNGRVSHFPNSSNQRIRRRRIPRGSSQNYHNHRTRERWGGFHFSGSTSRGFGRWDSPQLWNQCRANLGHSHGRSSSSRNLYRGGSSQRSGTERLNGSVVRSNVPRLKRQHSNVPIPNRYGSVVRNLGELSQSSNSSYARSSRSWERTQVGTRDYRIRE